VAHALSGRDSVIIRIILIRFCRGLASRPVSGRDRQTVTGQALLERYHRELLNFLTRQVSDRHAAADLAQESYARVLAVRQAGQPIVDVRALLYRTARNLLIDRHRRHAVRRHEDLDAIPEGELPHAPAHLQPEEALASMQAVQAYVATIEALPPRCREAFLLHVFDGLTHAQVGQHMGISASMVEKHIVRAMVACHLCARQLREGRRGG
jgi:RNA polymerase sigma factor (sigma-70 family)